MVLISETTESGVLGGVGGSVGAINPCLAASVIVRWSIIAISPSLLFTPEASTHDRHDAERRTLEEIQIVMGGTLGQLREKSRKKCSAFDYH
jgi:hypothetical protein